MLLYEAPAAIQFLYNDRKTDPEEFNFQSTLKATESCRQEVECLWLWVLPVKLQYWCNHVQFHPLMLALLQCFCVFVEGIHVSAEMFDQAAGFLFNFFFCCTYRLQRRAAGVHVAGCGGATRPGAGGSDWGCWDCAAASRTGCPNGLAVGTTKAKTGTHNKRKEKSDAPQQRREEDRKTEREERIVGRRRKKRVSKKSTKFHRVEKWKKEEKRNEVRRWGRGGKAENGEKEEKG